MFRFTFHLSTLIFISICLNSNPPSGLNEFNGCSNVLAEGQETVTLVSVTQTDDFPMRS